MTKINITFQMAVLFMICGCDSSPVVVPKPAAAPVGTSAPVSLPATASDPVEALKKLMESFQRKKAWVVFKTDQTGWEFEQSEIELKGFDVKKTDSLVSPLIGTIAIKRSRSYDRGPYASAEEAAQAGVVDAQWTDKSLITGTYTWQNEKWEFQSLEEQGLYRKGEVGKIYHWKASDLMRPGFILVNEGSYFWPFSVQFAGRRWEQVPPR